MSQSNEQLSVMTIEVAMTQQAQAYTSTKRAAIVPIFVTPSDDVMAVLEQKLAEVTHQVEEAIDHDFEVGHNRPAKYSQEPRMDYITYRGGKTIVLVPEELVYDPKELPNGWHHLTVSREGHRLEFLKKKLAKTREYKGYTILDCSQNMDALLTLPPIHKGVVTYNHQQGLAILTQDTNTPPTELKKEYSYGYWETTYWIGSYDFILDNSQEFSEKAKMALCLCWDGDFSQVPPPLPKPEPQDEDFEEDDEDEEDDE